MHYTRKDALRDCQSLWRHLRKTGDATKREYVGWRRIYKRIFGKIDRSPEIFNFFLRFSHCPCCLYAFTHYPQQSNPCFRCPLGFSWWFEITGNPVDREVKYPCMRAGTAFSRWEDMTPLDSRGRAKRKMLAGVIENRAMELLRKETIKGKNKQ